ncbi:iron-siderophore ABC transporter substrate-binding protein [Halomonas sp. PAMB 3232]|uniref:iron-siderophore ABC transporter substrate-binding protein n=1 Tax=Halomonas sp. PAMB 3232 TaxID=3075221 RepID=UPI00289FA9A0|nr:iron-siderophore ABC transporter substrate-binding protein [Halomonas sp. PAMB 3232]WNL38261.1 iron-siderophore ABC transporter substrate-binding protein [Halomonas sp. PAMB 3232]
MYALKRLKAPGFKRLGFKRLGRNRLGLKRLGLTALAAAALPLSPASATDYPLSIDHALGTAVLKQAPERIATVAWANHEVPLALGVVPVGFAAANFGDENGSGLLPWVEARLQALDAPAPTLYDEGDGIDFEAVAASRPDVILAGYSGLSQSDYDTLSQIAPVVGYREGPWATSWRDMIRLNSAGMGMAKEGDALIAELEAQIRETAARYPVLDGKTAMFVTHLDPNHLGRIAFYSDNDARVQFFHDLGLASPQVVLDNAAEGQFSGSISAELIDELNDVDILVTYGGESLLDELKANPLTSRLPAVANGAVVMLDDSPLGTAANPTPMSIAWVLDEYARLLADAARKAE